MAKQVTFLPTFGGYELLNNKSKRLISSTLDGQKGVSLDNIR